MKELSIEEKAKRYDEAIERARVWKEKSGMPADRQGILDDIFPELKVSEDEEVRKALYEYFKKLKDDGDIDETWYGFSYDKILAWLEKQGEDDKKGYSVWVGGFEINDYNLSKEEAEKLAEEYKKDGYDDVIVEKQGEQKPEEIVNLHDYLYGEQKPAWSENDEIALGDALWCCKQAASIAKDENDMGNIWYAERWLKSLKERYT